MHKPRRSAFTLFQLLIVVAILAFGFALSLPAIAKARAEAKKAELFNNLRQIVLGMHNHNDTYGVLPPGVDDKGFSAASKLLPFIEQNQVYSTIKFDKPVTDDANAAARKTVIPTFLSPRDPIKSVRDDSGATNYLFNSLVFSLNSKAKIPASFPDGLSNTIAVGETLKGDGKEKAEDVRRQYVLLKKEDLKTVTPDTGAATGRTASTSPATAAPAGWTAGSSRACSTASSSLTTSGPT